MFAFSITTQSRSKFFHHFLQHHFSIFHSLAFFQCFFLFIIFSRLMLSLSVLARGIDTQPPEPPKMCEMRAYFSAVLIVLLITKLKLNWIVCMNKAANNASFRAKKKSIDGKISLKTKSTTAAISGKKGSIAYKHDPTRDQPVLTSCKK